MEFKYKQAIETNGLKLSDLPEDAQIGIKQIDAIEKAMHMLVKNGKTPKEPTLKKIQALDKWVYFEILDYLQDKDENAEEAPVTKEEIIKDLKDDADDADSSDDSTSSSDDTNADTSEPVLSEEMKQGLAIEAELVKMHETGQTEWKIEDVRKVAKQTYDLLFDTYEEGEENGVSTSTYSLIEKANSDIFVLKKI